jgi:GGDEF domain-containing protein
VVSRDLILPILVPVLIANVALVALAARAIFRRPRGNGGTGTPARRMQAARSGAGVALRGTPPALPSLAEAPEPVEPAQMPPVEPVELPAAEPPPPSPAQPPRPPVGPTHTRRRGRSRRFELAAIHEDHERILRSIQTFLSPDGVTSDGGGRPGPLTTTSTIAVVGLTGYEALQEAAGQRVAEGVASAVRETLRRAARGTDRVVSLGGGRFCVLLPATGERAAASYLRRVHAACEPWLGAASPITLVVATASTGQDVDLEAALRRAERRFERAVTAGRPTFG